MRRSGVFSLTGFNPRLFLSMFLSPFPGRQIFLDSAASRILSSSEASLVSLALLFGLYRYSIEFHTEMLWVTGYFVF